MLVLRLSSLPLFWLQLVSSDRHGFCRMEWDGFEGSKNYCGQEPLNEVFYFCCPECQGDCQWKGSIPLCGTCARKVLQTGKCLARGDGAHLLTSIAKPANFLIDASCYSLPGIVVL